MAENGLILTAAGAAQLSLGSPAGLDDLASPFSILLLYDPGNLDPNDSFVAKVSGAGTAGWAFYMGAGPTLGFYRILSTAAVLYASTSFSAYSIGTRYWIAMCYDQSLGAGLKCSFFEKLESAGSFTDVGATATAEGSGSIVTDAAEPILSSYHAPYAQYSDLTDFAIGIVAGKKSAAQLQAITDDIQGTSWLALWGKPTANTSFPFLLGSASGAAAGTPSGTVTLDTTGPDWYTGSGGGTALVPLAHAYYRQQAA